MSCVVPYTRAAYLTKVNFQRNATLFTLHFADFADVFS